MDQYIKNANIFGRIGSGIGKGLAEQVPKEIENYRLKSGLQDVADASDRGELSPAQFLAKTAGTYGVTPQMIQSFGDIAKIQNQGNAYRKAAGGNPRPGQQTQGISPEASPMEQQRLSDIQFGNKQPVQGQNMPQNGPINNQQQTANQPSDQNVPQVEEGNVLNRENLTKGPWTPQQRNQAIAGYLDQGFLPDQSAQLAADDESRELAQPAAHRERQKEIEEAKGKVADTLKRHLEKKLQKEGKDVFKDVAGKMILNAERGMTRDLILNPRADIDNVANDWSERLYQTAQAKGKLNVLGTTTGLESIFKGSTPEKKLKEYQDIFKRSGNLEEYKDILQGPSFGMSAQGAASVAYPPNPKIANYISNTKYTGTTAQADQRARKAALEIGPQITSDDSVLSIARKLSHIDPYFDQQAFFDQISEDKNNLGLNERQRLELAEGAKGFLPNWADLLFLPVIRR